MARQEPPEPVRRRRFALSVGSLIVVCLIGAAVRPVSAQFLTRPTNLTYLARRADIVVTGRVLEARYESHPNYPHVPTLRVTLEVERMLRGPEVKRLVFREWLPPASFASAKRAYVVGQDLLLFLPLPSAFGLSSPIGYEQGRFHIVRDRQGRRMVVNEFGNAGLMKGVAEEAAKGGLLLDARDRRIAALQGGPILLEDFISFLERFMTLSKTP